MSALFFVNIYLHIKGKCKELCAFVLCLMNKFCKRFWKFHLYKTKSPAFAGLRLSLRYLSRSNIHWKPNKGISRNYAKHHCLMSRARRMPCTRVNTVQAQSQLVSVNRTHYVIQAFCARVCGQRAYAQRRVCGFAKCFIGFCAIYRWSKRRYIPDNQIRKQYLQIKP